MHTTSIFVTLFAAAGLVSAFADRELYTIPVGDTMDQFPAECVQRHRHLGDKLVVQFDAAWVHLFTRG